MVMETERLHIRRFRPGDRDDLFEYLSDPEVVRYEPYPAMTRAQVAEEARNRAKDDSFWAVCLRETRKLIGNLYFCCQEPKEFKTWELGYVFNRAYGGKGYATEAARRLVQYGFGTCGAHRIEARCNPLNAASWRLLERLDMRREGHMVKQAFFRRDELGKPIWNDTYIYAILAEEWKGCAQDANPKN